MTIYWDMDATLNKLYDYPNWLERLRAYDPTPYIKAEVLHNMSLLARYMNKVQKMGFHIGIISWLSKCSTEDYDEKVTLAKIEWLKKHLASVNFDEIHVVAYGTPKVTFKSSNDDILFDDEIGNREAWGENAFEPTMIIEKLKELVG